MCFKTKQKSQSYQSTNQTTGPDAAYQGQGQDLYSKASDLVASNPSQTYTGQRVADYGPEEGTAKSLINGMAGNDNADYTAARGNYTAVAGADDASKSVQDYMQPYLAGVLGPQIREMVLQGQQQRNKIGAQAALSGAFGDARQGVLESEQMRNEQQNIGDTTGKVTADAWNNATQQRNAALQRILAAGQAQQGLGTANDNRTQTTAAALSGLADKDKAVAQAKDNASYEDFNKEQQLPYQQLTWLMQMLGQTPHSTVSTGTSTGVNTQTGTDNSGLQLAGKLLGSFLIPGAGALGTAAAAAI